MIIWSVFNNHLNNYPSILIFSYINVLGFILFILYFIQVFTGILLSIYYNDFFIIAFDSVVALGINVNNGWFIRLLHVIGASLYIFFLYLHLIRAQWLKLKIIYVRYISWITYYIGVIILALSLLNGFLGYILCWGQMSYWGVTVMINIVGVINKSIGTLIWNAAWNILNRIFIYHFLIGLVIGAFIFLHIYTLHCISSSNPFINSSSSYQIPFTGYIFKDLFSCFLVFTFLFIPFLFIEPDILGNSDNQILANPLKTPTNILPEWYFLLFYSCLRSIPNKQLGILIVVFLLIIILL